jgi:hypothetical protein
MSSSALLSLEVMEQVKGYGTLGRKSQHSTLPSLLHNQQDVMSVPYAAAREWVLIGSSISAVAFDVENGEKRGNNDKKNTASAKCLPGQIRFPSPNIVDNTGSSRALPSELMNRSGLKESGSG